METKWLGPLITVLTCACSGTSLELGVLESGGGGAMSTGGEPAKGGMKSAVVDTPKGGVASTADADGGAETETAGTGPTSPSASTPEDDGSDCPVPSLPGVSELAEIETLPDPFQMLDGTRIATRADWRCRRQEIKKQAEKYAFGTKPPPPTLVSGSVNPSVVTVNVSDNGNTASFTANVTLPTTGTPPYSAIIAFDGLTALDRSVLNAEGVATIAFDTALVGHEGASRGANQQGAFYELYSGGSQRGLLIAWAWGVSRIIDVIEQSGSALINPRAIGVTGCSRFGKGAFLAGAFDQRIALTLPVESGTSGVPVWRGVANGEIGENGQASQSLSSAYGEQPWFADGFDPFKSNVTKNPIDTHELVAMVAPRGLLLFDNPYVGELSAQYSHLAALGGAEVYKALGADGNLGYLSDEASGVHCATRPEWQAPLRAAVKKFLSQTGSDPQVIAAKAGYSANLSEWRDWTTPTLE